MKKTNSQNSLSISIVTYKSDREVLKRLLESIKSEISLLGQGYTIERISIIDNSNQESELKEVLKDFLVQLPCLEISSNNANLGYGSAHNRAIVSSNSNYHLILNPDVILEQQCLLKGLELLESEKSIAIISPSVVDKTGNVQYLTKKYPSVFDLLLRGLNISILNTLFEKRLNKYENRMLVQAGKNADVEIISGCCMLSRTKLLKEIGGFDENYFLYFEDFSLSLKMNSLGRLVFFPGMKIIHYGGNAAGKGFKHIFYFIRSGIRFFNCYGWKIL